MGCKALENLLTFKQNMSPLEGLWKMLELRQLLCFYLSWMAFDDEIPLSVLDVVNLGPKSKFQMRFRYYDRYYD